ncbi:MAG: S-layer homology domain-containing protein [Defluviitaleaceae bacterium]|nr:S-layer homology domain-containing protein [Defluviitaleaceae bacterium]
MSKHYFLGIFIAALFLSIIVLFPSNIAYAQLLEISNVTDNNNVLSTEDWFEWFNALTQEEQLTISFRPSRELVEPPEPYFYVDVFRRLWLNFYMERISEEVSSNGVMYWFATAPATLEVMEAVSAEVFLVPGLSYDNFGSFLGTAGWQARESMEPIRGSRFALSTDSEGQPIFIPMPVGTTFVLESGVYIVYRQEGPDDWFIIAVGEENHPFETFESPSGWAADIINEAIIVSIAPPQLIGSYTSPITRAEFTALAAALYEMVTAREIPYHMTFNDTTDINVQKMGSLGVVTGVGDGNFNPEGKLTREQAAVILARLARLLTDELPQSDLAAKFEQIASIDAQPKILYADMETISDWAYDAVRDITLLGIMSGIGENIFSPNSEYTREQSIVTIMRIYDLVK